jgi:translation initiation factor 4G
MQEAGIFGHNLTQEMRDNFFMESVFLSSAHKLDRGTLGGLADMFGQMPGM